MTNPEIMEAMQTLSKGNVGKTATARIRNIFDGIELAMNAGVKREVIWESINKIDGYKMPLKTFESAIYRIRKERGKQKKHTVATTSVLSTPAISVPGTNPLRALTGKPKDGDFNSIPTAKFEVDNS